MSMSALADWLAEAVTFPAATILAEEPQPEEVEDALIEEEVSEAGEKEAEAEEDEEEEEEEEEEEDEPVDPAPAIYEDCKHSKDCSAALHHFEECSKRVENGASEDCVEEFFHLQECADKCAAPRVFAQLK